MPEICLLGTGGMLPLKNRFLTSLYAEYDGKAILIDCGEGTQVAIAQHGLKISHIETILITHGHADHIAGLPGLLLSIGNCSRINPIDLYVPESIEKIINNLISICGGLPYEIKIHKLPDKESTVFTADRISSMLTVFTIPLEHSVNCLGYKLSLSRKPVFEPEKAKKLNVPVKYWKVLHSGSPVMLDDGREILPENVIKEKRSSINISYVTDTLPIDEIKSFVSGSDLFICEGMYGDISKKQSMNEKGHMLMHDACKIALESNVEKLWLTHYSPAENNPHDYEEELKNIFYNVNVSNDGDKISL